MYVFFCNLASINGALRHINLSLFFLISSNLLLDIVFANLDMDMFGIGLATSISYIGASIIIMCSFFNTKIKKPIVFCLNKPQIKYIRESAMPGLVSFSSISGFFITIFIINNLISYYGSYEGMAAFTVQRTISSMLGCVPFGSGIAITTLGSY